MLQATAPNWTLDTTVTWRGVQEQRIWKRIDTCERIIESICCKPEVNTTLWIIYQSVSSVAQSCLTLGDPMNPQHTRPPCPSPTPGVYSNPCPSSRWCHPAISSSVIPYSSCLQSLPASGSFPMSQLFDYLNKIKSFLEVGILFNKLFLHQKGQIRKNKAWWVILCLCWNFSNLSLWWKRSSGQNMNEWVRLCSNNDLFMSTEMWISYFHTSWKTSHILTFFSSKHFKNWKTHSYTHFGCNF